MKRTVLAVSCLLLAAGPVSAQSRGPLEGVWKVAEVVFPEASPLVRPGAPRTIANPEPSILIFTPGYFSRMTLEQPRGPVAARENPQNLTDADKLALFEHWRPLSASAGTYEVQGSTIVARAIIAKNAAVMNQSGSDHWEFKLEGTDTLWLLPPKQRAAIEPRARLVRLE